MREAVLHGTHVREAAARVHDGGRCAWFAREEEEPRVGLPRVCGLLRVGVDVNEHGLPRRGAAAHVVHHVDRRLRVKRHVPGELQVAQRTAVRVTSIYGEEQPPPLSQHGVGGHVRYAGIARHVHKLPTFRRSLIGGCILLHLRLKRRSLLHILLDRPYGRDGPAARRQGQATGPPARKGGEPLGAVHLKGCWFPQGLYAAGERPGLSGVARHAPVPQPNSMVS